MKQLPSPGARTRMPSNDNLGSGEVIDITHLLRATLDIDKSDAADEVKRERVAELCSMPGGDGEALREWLITAKQHQSRPGWRKLVPLVATALVVAAGAVVAVKVPAVRQSILGLARRGFGQAVALKAVQSGPAIGLAFGVGKATRGVCTPEVMKAFLKQGIDLAKYV